MRVLQVEQYGLIIFAQSVVQYFILFTDYGFNLLGPREIAQHDSAEERGSVFSNVFFAKLFLSASNIISGLGCSACTIAHLKTRYKHLSLRSH